MQPISGAGIAMLPIGMQGNGQDRGVMRPVFKQGAVGLGQGFERGRAVALATRPQDHVVRAGDGVDAVNLHETDAGDETGQIGTLGWAGRGLGQRMFVQEKAAGKGVGKLHAATLASAGIAAKQVDQVAP